jgi:phage gpG-like protein
MQFQTSINSNTVETGLKNFQAALADFSAPLKKVADDFRAMIAEQFSTEGRAGGTPWAPLAPSTLKRRRGAGSTILNSSGALLASLADAGAAGHVESGDGLSLELGTSLPYAKFFQTGTGWGYGVADPGPGPHYGRGMPMRPILVLTSNRRNQWVQFVQQNLSAKTIVLGASQLGGSK